MILTLYPQHKLTKNNVDWDTLVSDLQCDIKYLEGFSSKFEVTWNDVEKFIDITAEYQTATFSVGARLTMDGKVFVISDYGFHAQYLINTYPNALVKILEVMPKNMVLTKEEHFLAYVDAREPHILCLMLSFLNVLIQIEDAIKKP